MILDMPPVALRWQSLVTEQAGGMQHQGSEARVQRWAPLLTSAFRRRPMMDVGLLRRVPMMGVLSGCLGPSNRPKHLQQPDAPQPQSCRHLTIWQHAEGTGAKQRFGVH